MGVTVQAGEGSLQGLAKASLSLVDGGTSPAKVFDTEQ